MKLKKLVSVFSGIIILIIFSGCDYEDVLTNKKSFVKIELAGPLKNGVFKIERENAASNFQLALGLIMADELTGDETALLTFEDIDQELRIVFAFPAEKGLNELLFDETDEYISIAFAKDELILASKLVSLNITSFEKMENTQSGISGTFKAKGTFTGIVVHIDVVNNMEYTHILTGEFEFNPF